MLFVSLKSRCRWFATLRMFLCILCKYKRLNRWINGTSRLVNQRSFRRLRSFLREKCARKIMIKVLIELKYRMLHTRTVEGKTIYRRSVKWQDERSGKWDLRYLLSEPRVALAGFNSFTNYPHGSLFDVDFFVPRVRVYLISLIAVRWFRAGRNITALHIDEQSMIRALSCFSRVICRCNGSAYVKKDLPGLWIYMERVGALNIINDVENNVTTDRIRESVIQKQINICY